MVGPRLIDQNERARKKPMRILVLGMCRTGTTSIAAALRRMGYSPHHMREVLAHPTEVPLWREALDVTLLPPNERPPHRRNAKPYGREEFDKLLSEYDVVTDLPGVAFSKELVQAYPEAKVILTNRKYEDWEKSMQSSIWITQQWKLFTLCRDLNISHLAPLLRMVHTMFKVHNGNHYGGPEAKTAYQKHYDTIRELVPKNNLLEFGPDFKWEPLCEFLGEKVPDQEYPRMNESAQMRQGLERMWWGVFWYLVQMVLLPGGVTVIAVVMFYWRDAIGAWADEQVLGRLRMLVEK